MFNFVQFLGASVTPFTPLDIIPITLALICLAIAAVMVRILQKKPKMDAVEKVEFITNYTRAEYYLATKGKIKIEDMVSYHSSVNWANYAGFSFTALFVSISLIDFPEVQDGFNWSTLVSKDFVAMGILLISAIIMAMIDRVFTNNLSPIVTLKTRFRITYFCVHWGGLAFFLTIFALSIYFSKFGTWLAPLLNGILLFTAYAAGKRRQISMDCLVEEHGLTHLERQELEKILTDKEAPWKGC